MNKYVSIQTTEQRTEIQELTRENNRFSNQLGMTDEAQFQLNGFVNKQNC